MNADAALEWYLELDDQEERAVEEWLADNPRPQGRSGIGFAYEHREDIPGVDNAG